VILKEVSTLILAAGASRRMGKPKALLPWGATTVLKHLLDIAESAGSGKILVVTGSHREELESALASTGVATHYNPHWENGMGASLASGIEAVEQRFPEAGAVLVLLADQPLVTTSYLGEIRKEHLEHPGCIIASDYGSFAGVPALFPKGFWNSLKGLSSEKGARNLIASNREKCRVLDPGMAITDIDTPQAYQAALQKAGLPQK
jgi:molybdenum cofactor cytidylyltransferase